MEITNNNLDEHIKEGTVLVDFYAQWCGPCKMLSPVLEKIEEETDFKVLKVDVDQNGDLAMKYGIRSIPSLFFFKDGKMIENVTGALPKEEIISKLENL